MFALQPTNKKLNIYHKHNQWPLSSFQLSTCNEQKEVKMEIMKTWRNKQGKKATLNRLKNHLINIEQVWYST